MSIIEEYIERLLKESTPKNPIWNIEKNGNAKPHWNYIDGCMILSLIDLFEFTQNKDYIEFADNFIDYYIDDQGEILGYKLETYNLDSICEGRTLFKLYEYTKKEKYLKAINKLYSQLMTQPRTFEGSFWHKEIYPNQVWLDGLFMAQPFYITYETKFNKMKNYFDIIKQYQIVREKMYDRKAHLYYHGYDASKKMFWADKKTGLSKSFWLRAIGWYTISLAENIELINEQIYEDKRFFMDLLKETIDGLLSYQDPQSKLFYQVVDKPEKEGNYLETSGSLMISYAILKGVRLEALPDRYLQIGLDILNSVIENKLTVTEHSYELKDICLVAGLGPGMDSKRDGTFEYYVSEPRVCNDAKGVGPLVMAYVEYLRYKTKK